MTKSQPIPLGFCQCGCGQKTKLAPCTKPSKGWVKGRPLRFVANHNRNRNKVEYVIDSESGCWEWQLALDEYGYGQLCRDGKNSRAHRIIYERHRGPISQGFDLHHLCGNRRCVNPDHLEPLDRTEHGLLHNPGAPDLLRDCLGCGVTLKRRQGEHRNAFIRRKFCSRICGIRHCHSQLNPAMVKQIRACVAAGATQAQVAHRFGVGCTAVNNIVHRRTWADVL